MAEAVSIKNVYDELKRIEQKMATKEDVESLKETFDIITNPKTMRQIAASMVDIREGKEKEISSVQDMLDEM